MVSISCVSLYPLPIQVLIISQVIGTSSFLREYSHGKSMEMIQKVALEVIEYVKSQNVEVRFSSEDSFRSDLVDILALYKAVDKAGVDRVGVADTVGGATPRMVYDLVRTLRGVVSCDIECHFHDDTGCAVANSLQALEAGASFIDTSVLGKSRRYLGIHAGLPPQGVMADNLAGIGERNGITPLGALIARMVVISPDYVTKKYNLKALKSLEELVADAVQINIPFNNPVTGFCVCSPSITIFRPFQLIRDRRLHTRRAFTPRPFSRTLQLTRSSTLACLDSPDTSRSTQESLGGMQ